MHFANHCAITPQPQLNSTNFYQTKRVHTWTLTSKHTSSVTSSSSSYRHDDVTSAAVARRTASRQWLLSIDAAVATVDRNKFGRKLNHFIDNEDVMANERMHGRTTRERGTRRDETISLHACDEERTNDTRHRNAASDRQTDRHWL